MYIVCKVYTAITMYNTLYTIKICIVTIPDNNIAYFWQRGTVIFLQRVLIALVFLFGMTFEIVLLT